MPPSVSQGYDIEKIRMRAKAFKERPLILNGVDPLKYLEQAKQSEIKPYMSVYFSDKFLVKEPPRTSKGTKRPRRNISTKITDAVEEPRSECLDGSTLP